MPANGSGAEMPALQEGERLWWKFGFMSRIRFGMNA